MVSTSMRIALVGNPNCGKTALFNQLTGARQKVANYAGVTVERKEGTFVTPAGKTIRVLDLPGTYSLSATSLDEKVTHDVLHGIYAGEPVPELIVCVVDATNLRLHLRFVLEILALGRPTVLALNMMDAARRRGIDVDVHALARELGIPVIETVAIARSGVRALVDTLDGITQSGSAVEVRDADHAAPHNMTLDTRDLHAEVRRIMRIAVRAPDITNALDERLDGLALHPVIGMLLLAAVMFLIFQAVYFVGKPMTDAIGDGFGWLGEQAGAYLPDGPLRSLVVDGIFGGLGTVLGFLPEILVLFFFILVLEESGYLPRAAFLLDRMMVKVGLTGRSFIPLLSSFACAIPGIMGTRSIADPRQRLTTILVAPLMTCSARLPVYALLIGAFIPDRPVLGVFKLPGLVLFAMYVAGISGAMAVGWISKRLRGTRSQPPLLMELPSYRMPKIRNLALGLWERGWIFVRRLSGVILALTVIMWFISTFPSAPAGATGPAIDYSFAGYIGRALEVIFAPLGFNWQISISLVPAFAARETAVTALATVYAVAGGADDAAGLAAALSSNVSLATALSLLAWFAFAPQCMSTLAVIRRETQSWRYVLISFSYMFGLAYFVSFVTYRLALWLL
ncbi:ferrous iron transporter B [Pandoraea bronchicola]|uniref:Fe(2+) transporter FeoB n=1 Tax=Pandoraea bronchicola TaxID=2508287 RepID=A0A5E5BJ37_9BURK|nr:ferrous iron transporter B [Pandoraea bronchicola]VVE86251.1 Fe2+ transport system protein B [Pandoraea bronchicola]